MHFMEVGPWQGLKPAANPEHLRGAEASLFHGEAVLLAFFSNLLVYNLSHKGFWEGHSFSRAVTSPLVNGL
jgi:hypothetical protein